MYCAQLTVSADIIISTFSNIIVKTFLLYSTAFQRNWQDDKTIFYIFIF